LLFFASNCFFFHRVAFYASYCNFCVTTFSMHQIQIYTCNHHHDYKNCPGKLWGFKQSRDFNEKNANVK
jgi:hypothetical protein